MNEQIPGGLPIHPGMAEEARAEQIRALMMQFIMVAAIREDAKKGKEMAELIILDAAHTSFAATEDIASLIFESRTYVRWHHGAPLEPECVQAAKKAGHPMVALVKRQHIATQKQRALKAVPVTTGNNSQH